MSLTQLLQPSKFELRWVVRALAALCAIGLICGGYRWHQTLGRIHETHTVGEYRFRITSERDPAWADCGESGENIAVSVYHNDRLIADPVHIGSIDDDATPPTFAIRILANESLIILVRTDREHSAVFAYDDSTGATWPLGEGQTSETRESRRAHFEARIRSYMSDERYNLYIIYGG